MAPTEETILTTFLLTPAPLPTILTLKAFAELFPRSQQSSPQIKSLYRDLQSQRARITDGVGRNIASELKRGNAQRREVVKARRRGEAEEQDDEVDVENALYEQTSNLPTSRSHTLSTILPELETAAEETESDARRLEEEAERLLEEMRTTVGSLSDLRYGRFANDQLREQMIEGLDRLRNSCDQKEK